MSHTGSVSNVPRLGSEQGAQGGIVTATAKDHGKFPTLSKPQEVSSDELELSQTQFQGTGRLPWLPARTASLTRKTFSPFL